MGLHIGIFRAEQLLGTLDGNTLDLVNVLAAAVIALAGVALGVFIRQDCAHGGDDGGGGDIFRSDQLDILPLPPQLPFHGRGQGRVRLLQDLPLVHPAHSFSGALDLPCALFRKNGLDCRSFPVAQARW